MTDRRRFIQTTLTVASGIALGQASTAFAASSDSSCSEGIIYTANNPGKWANKVGGHEPQVSVKGNQVTITTEHGMSERHYIVRHTLVDAKGTVLGAKTFYPSDEPVSSFKLPTGYTGKLQATSYCNKHDLWVAEFTV
jgi:superoxide reductase